MAERFVVLAHEYLAKAAEADRATEMSVLSDIDGPPALPGDVTAGDDATG